MKNLKNRIEDLLKSTGSLVTEECTTALEKLNKFNAVSYNISEEAKNELKTDIVSDLILEIKNHTDSDVNNFIERESRLLKIHNMGIRTAIKAISESDLADMPAIAYAVETFSKNKLPEYLIAEQFYLKLKQFDWHPVVKENLDNIKESAEKNRDDILIHIAMYEMENSSSSYILTAIKESVNNFMLKKSKYTKAQLEDKLSKFTFDPLARNLANAIRESRESEFSVAASQSGNAIVENIYAPILVGTDSEIFGIGNNFYVKSGNNIKKIDEHGLQSLDPNFINLTKFISSTSVKILEGEITVFTQDKKVVITEEMIFINEKHISHKEFRRIYMNSGVFRPDELAVLRGVEQIIENYGSIVELDFAKRFTSPFIGNRRIDVIKLNENIFITKEDPAMGNTMFYENINALDARNMVLEFLNFDISESFGILLEDEEYKLKEHNKTKRTYLDTITSLEEKLQKLMDIRDTDILESTEYKSIINIINEEVADLKIEYNEFVSRPINSKKN